MPETYPPEPVSTQAARIASLAAAANLVLSGNGLANRLHTETIVIDLMDVAGILAARLATETEDLAFPTQGA